MITAGTKPGVEMFQLEEVCHEQILSVLDERERYLLLMLADFGTAVFSAKLIVHIIALGTLWF